MIYHESLTTEPEKDYHSSSQYWMSSHKLADIRNNREPDFEFKPAYAFGSWCHKYILEGMEEFMKYAVVGAPRNSKGDEYGMTSKAYGDWYHQMQELGYEAVPWREFHKLQVMHAAVHSNKTAGALLQHGFPENVGRVLDYCGVKCQIRCDWLTHYDGEDCLVDLKTCRDIQNFRTDAMTYEYGHQMAFYRAVLRKLTGRKFTVRLVAVDKKETPGVACIRVHDEFLDECQQENEECLSILAKQENCAYLA